MLSEEQVDLAVEQLEESDAGPAMRATLTRVTGRLSVHESNGVVTMRAESQDRNMEIWGVVRLVSANPKKEESGHVDGWCLPTKDLEHGELFCAFGAGAEHPCLVSFGAPHRVTPGGHKRSTNGPGVLVHSVRATSTREGVLTWCSRMAPVRLCAG